MPSLDGFWQPPCPSIISLCVSGENHTGFAAERQTDAFIAHITTRQRQTKTKPRWYFKLRLNTSISSLSWIFKLHQHTQHKMLHLDDKPPIYHHTVQETRDQESSAPTLTAFTNNGNTAVYIMNSIAWHIYSCIIYLYK